jgi:LysR family transcriptional regulator for metE and metH
VLTYDEPVTVPLRLDVRQYETVVAIIECGTMTEAAKQLMVSQSALSHRLSDAEKRLGVQLFTRGADRRLSPTRHGVVVHQAAAPALAALSRLEQSFADADDRVEVTIRLGVAAYDCYSWFPEFLRHVRTARPEVDLDLIAVDDAPGHALAERSVDLVIAPGMPQVGDIELVPVRDDELVLLCSPSHRLASAPQIEATDLANETYLTYNALPSPGFEFDRFIRPSGDVPRIVRVVRQTSAIVELVAAGVGLSILSRWATADAVESGRLAAVGCGTAGLPITWHAAHRRGDEWAADIAVLLRQRWQPAE